MKIIIGKYSIICFIAHYLNKIELILIKDAKMFVDIRNFHENDSESWCPIEHH